MNRRAAWVAAAASAGAVAGLGSAWWWRDRNRTASGERTAAAGVWSTPWVGIDGLPLADPPRRGQPLILNFWATWCAPCLTEMPLLDAFWRDRATHGVQVLALALDRADPVRDYATRLKLALPMALAIEGGFQLARSLGNAAGVLPFTCCFDRRGDLFKHRIGVLDEAILARWRAELR